MQTACDMLSDRLLSRECDFHLYYRTILVRSAATFAAMALYWSGYLPAWGLVLANAVLYPAIYLRIHDIGHGSALTRLRWTARFVPVTNPMWGGTRVFALVHKEHHKHLGTTRDPWLPYYAGHPLRALFFNLIEPEYSLVQYVRMHGADRELAGNILWNLGAIAAGLALFQWAYVLHLASQRLVHGAGIFFFNFYPHRESLSAGAAIGTWERERELRPVLPLLRLVWGRDTVDGLIYHNRHHCMGQQHVPVQHYKHLRDTGIYTRHEQSWPVARVRRL